LHSSGEEVGARRQKVDVTEILVLAHPLLVSVREARRLVLDVVVLQHLIDVLVDVLVELRLRCLNPSDCVPSNHWPVSNPGKDERDHQSIRCCQSSPPSS
ncbi:hypothetical protein PMAYCL1PPCAC_15851, partial [Pristionchus mayeri]